MTGETEVRCELSEISKVTMEDKSGLDTSLCEDLPPKVGGDHHGDNKPVTDDKQEEEAAAAAAEDTNLNASGKDDPDGSYVFVSRGDSAYGDLVDRDLNAERVHKSQVVSESKKDVEGQVGELNDENGEIASANVVTLDKDVEGQAGELTDNNGEIASAKSGTLDKDVEDLVGELNDENGKIASLEHKCIGDVAPDGSLGKPNAAGDDALVQVQIATAIVESDREGLNGEVRLEEQIEPHSASDLEENQKLPIKVSEVDDCGTSPLDGGKIDSGDKIHINSTVELGEFRESQALVMEVGDLHDGEEKPEKQNTLANTNFMESDEAQIVHSEPSEGNTSLLEEGKLNPEEHANVEFPTKLEGSKESQVMAPEAAECKSPKVEFQLDDGKIESEEQIKLNSTADMGEVQESRTLVQEVGDLHDGEVKPDKQNAIKNSHFKESDKAQIGYSKPSECESSVLDGGKLNSEEDSNVELSAEIEGSQESQVMDLEAAECKSPEVKDMKVIPEKLTELESPREVQESFESETTKLEAAGLESYQLDHGEEMLEEEEKTDLRLDIEENKESPLVGTDNLISGTEELNKVAELANETVPLETEIADEHVLDQNNDRCCPTSHVEASLTQAKVLNEIIDGSQDSIELNVSEPTKRLPSPADCKRPESEIGSEPVDSVLYCPAKDAELEIEVKSDRAGGDITTSFSEVCSATEIESDVSNTVTDCACIQPIADNILNPEFHANDSLQNGSCADVKLESQVKNCPPVSIRDMPCSDGDVTRAEVLDSSVVNLGSAPDYVPEALIIQDDGVQVNGGDGTDFDKVSSKKIGTEQVHGNEIPAPQLEGASSDALNEQSTGVEGVKRPFNFLIKIPRYDDEQLREQIRRAQLQVIEKTQLRDAFRVDIQRITANCQQLRNSREAAKSEARSARGLVNLKRQEIDSVQSVINRVKNAISVEDIDVRINSMEHMIQHETLDLKEEKQFIREIKQLKHLREQLSSNMGSQDEVQQALDQRDRIEERLKILKKELDCLKDKVSKAHATTAAAEKKWNDESKKLKELHVQFRAADDVRQEAYVHLQNLKRQLYEKNTRFRMYKDDTTAAYDYASNQDKGALNRLCVNQVETVMDIWNKDDEFRKEYLRCNARSTLRRFRTSDGRALGPDEEPTALPNVVDESIDRSLSTTREGNSELPILALEQEKQVSTVAAAEETDGKSAVKVAEQTDLTAKTKKPGKPPLMTGSATVSGRDETAEMSEEENKQKKEELELARKEEELRKEEVAAKLKEQRRLEEKAKAKEAVERKRKIAEKAQIKAELRAQKEAEQKEKEREKKAKKRERKKAAFAEGPDGNNEGETVPTSESAMLTTKEPDIEETPVTVTKRPQKASQFAKQSKAKSIPPPLRNRGKRRMQQWIWIILTAVVVLALFLLGNIGFYANLAHNLRMRSSGF